MSRGFRFTIAERVGWFAVALMVLITGASSETPLSKPPSAKPASYKQASRPNILVIMPDDVGYWNVGVYSHGMMVPTPNIDRIAKEGILFTDHYSQPTCTQVGLRLSQVSCLSAQA